MPVKQRPTGQRTNLIRLQTQAEAEEEREEEEAEEMEAVEPTEKRKRQVDTFGMLSTPNPP